MASAFYIRYRLTSRHRGILLLQLALDYTHAEIISTHQLFMANFIFSLVFWFYSTTFGVKSTFSQSFYGYRFACFDF